MLNMSLLQLLYWNRTERVVRKSLVKENVYIVEEEGTMHFPAILSLFTEAIKKK